MEEATCKGKGEVTGGWEVEVPMRVKRGGGPRLPPASCQTTAPGQGQSGGHGCPPDWAAKSEGPRDAVLEGQGGLIPSAGS